MTNAAKIVATLVVLLIGTDSIALERAPKQKLLEINYEEQTIWGASDEVTSSSHVTILPNGMCINLHMTPMKRIFKTKDEFGLPKLPEYFLDVTTHYYECKFES